MRPHGETEVAKAGKPLRDESTVEEHNDARIQGSRRSEDQAAAATQIASRASQPQNFTIRGILLGLAIGTVICFSNIYFGLQTGWISGMSMPASLVGFAFFKTISSHLRLPFTPVENVLVQTVAGSVGTMPLGCGFVGVLPALEFLLRSDENGPLNISLGKLMIWAIGLCLFGVVFAVPLRKEVIIREKLKFPTGTATALLISVLHGGGKEAGLIVQEDANNTQPPTQDEERAALMGHHRTHSHTNEDESIADREPYIDNELAGTEHDPTSKDWRSEIKIMSIAFATSAAYTLISYFIPQLHNLPVFGFALANNWLWAFNPSPAYVAQGIIMGPATTLHMLFGAIIGWAILSPIAKHYEWAPGPVSDWETGSKGWIVWISLAIMLADSLVSLGWLILRPTIGIVQRHGSSVVHHIQRGDWSIIGLHRYLFGPKSKPLQQQSASDADDDAPLDHLVSWRAFIFWAIASVAIYIASTNIAFPGIIPFSSIVLALLISLVLSVMGVRALGETDLNPVSGISKLTQLIFAAVVPASNPNAVIINLVAGAVSEAGALQAGDLLADLKCGHLLGASPAAQFHGQIIGSVVGAIVSACIYKLYTSVYEVPSGQFQVPTAYVWIFAARLVTGKGLPPMAWQFSVAAGAVFALATVARTVYKDRWWRHWIPGGIAVAVGMYNTPSFTLARAVGGMVHWWYVGRTGRKETPVIVLASGLILGEGLCSIVNLLLASLHVPHL